MKLLILTSMAIFYIMYKRYFPVSGARFISLNDLKLDNIKIIDVRDFNESYKDPITGAANIPIAYLKRNMKEIPNDILHVVGSSVIEINIGIRFLRQKGFRVDGYTILENNPLPMKETC
jgi:rhodanese-related sulfurtransferase